MRNEKSPTLTTDQPTSWYEVIDVMAQLWLLLVSVAWMFKLNDPAYYALLLWCNLIAHMGEPVA